MEKRFRNTLINRYALRRSVLRTTDLESTFKPLSIVFLPVLFFFLVGKVANQHRFPHESYALVLCLLYINYV